MTKGCHLNLRIGPSPRAATIIRRTLFVGFLVLWSVIPDLVYNVSLAVGIDPWSIWSVAYRLFAIDSILAVWLIARTSIWSSWSGLGRVGLYLTAYVCGQAIANNAWYLSERFTFALAAVLTLFIVTWFALPASRLLGGTLSEPHDPARLHTTFSVRGLIAYVAAAAYLISVVRYLAITFLPQPGTRHLSEIGRIVCWLDGLDGDRLMMLPRVVFALIILRGFTMRWSVRCLALLLGSGCDFALRSACHALVAYFTTYRYADWFWLEGQLAEEVIITVALMIIMQLGLVCRGDARTIVASDNP